VLYFFRLKNLRDLIIVRHNESIMKFVTNYFIDFLKIDFIDLLLQTVP